MRRVRDIETAVLTRPGRYKQVADNLQVKEVWVGDDERRKRYVLCLNPQEAERERARHQQLLAELDAELALLEQREDDHPKAACALMASRRYGRYLSADWRGRPQLDTAKVKAAEKFDGKFVVISNDDTVKQAGHTHGIVAMHPVAQRLPVHPTLPRGRLPALAFHHKRQRQHPTRGSRISSTSRLPPQIRRRVLRSRDRHRHRSLLHNEEGKS